MEVENGKNVEDMSRDSSPFTPQTKVLPLILVVLRFGAMLSTATAALVMGLNKETKILTLGIIGTASINQTHIADFKQTPSLMYFVIANSIASVYNLSALILSLYAKRKPFSSFVHLTDTVVLALVATASSVAAAIGNLQKNGNFYNRWFPICSMFQSFCDQGETAIIVAFVGVGFLLMLCMLSSVVIYRNVVKR